MILVRAWLIHFEACDPFRVPVDRRLAHPFGTPQDMPPHEWHVSWDVMQALYEASPLPYPMPNPKSGDDGTTRLFGWPVVRDNDLPAGTMRLDPVSGTMSEPVEPEGMRQRGLACEYCGAPGHFVMVPLPLDVSRAMVTDDAPLTTFDVLRPITCPEHRFLVIERARRVQNQRDFSHRHGHPDGWGETDPERLRTSLRALIDRLALQVPEKAAELERLARSKGYDI